MSNPLSRFLDWLHAGYPEGVPPKDYFPLIALLTRTLDGDELREIVATVIRENPDGDIRRSDVEQTIERVKSAPIAPADVRDVASRLAAVGWPLSELERQEQSSAQADGDGIGILQKIEGWLSAGFPNGVPPQDRVPLMALLHRRLTDEEVDQIAKKLVHRADPGDPISSVDAKALIMATTNEVPTPQEVDRVSSRLAAKGWPLEG